MTAAWSPPNWLWGYFIPVGLLLLTWGGLEKRKARRIAPLVGFSLAVTAVCYWAVGFAFHMGGAQAINPDDPSLKGLGVLYTLLPDQPGWGFIGLDAFFLSGEAIGTEVYGFFLSYLPLVATSVWLVSLALDGLHRGLILATSILTASIVTPVAFCWVWGSGWLARLGETMGFGSGYVDFGGGSLVLWVPSLMMVGFLIVQQKRDMQNTASQSPPATITPIMANLGVLLMGIGWMGWILSNPFHIVGANIHWQRTALNIVLGMAGAALTSQLYAWLTLGAPEALIAARGLAAGWGGVMVGAPFFSPLISLILGLFSGLIFPFVHYIAETRAKLRSAAATLAIGITAGIIGSLSVALLANGRWGQGWNNIGSIGQVADTVQTSLGVSGFFTTRGIAQLKAQVIGLVALGLWGLMWGVLSGVFVRFFSRQLLHKKAVEDESTIVDAKIAEPLPELIPGEQPPRISDAAEDAILDLLPEDEFAQAASKSPTNVAEEA